MSSSQNNVIVTLLYADNTKRNYVFEHVRDNDCAPLPIKDKINAINENANNEYENFYKIFVSNGGASFVKIDGAKIVSVAEEVIYSG